MSQIGASPAGFNRKQSFLFVVCAMLLVSVATTHAFYTVFSRSMSLDEGYLMTTVQSFSEGNPLYDSVFTQYGPFYYAYEWLIHTLLRVPLTHDATRVLCILHWLTAAALLGWAGRRLTGSPLAGLFVFAQTMIHLTPLANEPGHPQELVAMLLALGLLVMTRDPHAHPSPAMLGIISALLLFTKINVGLFFCFAVALSIYCCAADRFVQPIWRWAILAFSTSVPFALMRHHLGAEWCRNCSLVAATAIGTTVLVATRQKREAGLGAEMTLARRGFHFGDLALGFIAVAAVLLVITIWTGTSWRGLMDGLLLTPLKMPGVALLPLPIPNVALANAVASLGLGMIVLGIGVRKHEEPSGRVEWVLPSLKLLYGLAGALCLVGNPKAQFTYLLPWGWLVLVPSFAKSAETSSSVTPTSRIYLCLAAVWQGLQVYPIAGTQVTMATLLLVPCYAVCLSDGLLYISRKPWSAVRIALPLARWLVGFALPVVFAFLWCKLPSVRREYANLPSLDLPGSRWVRMEPEIVTMYQSLARYLDAHCDTFVTYPGINSLYFWTGKRPPTHLNSTGWGQLSHEQQKHILAALRKARRPMLVVVAAEAERWKAYTPAPIAPLVRCVHEDCREVARIGRFIIYIPENSMSGVDGIGAAKQPVANSESL